MPSGEINDKVLLVEGKSDLFVISEFIEKNGIKWKTESNKPIVYIEHKDSKEELLNEKNLSSNQF